MNEEYFIWYPKMQSWETFLTEIANKIGFPTIRTAKNNVNLSVFSNFKIVDRSGKIHYSSASEYPLYIERITVHLKDDRDIIYLYTDMRPVNPEISTDNACLSINAQRDTGKNYVDDMFVGIPCEVYNTRLKG